MFASVGQKLDALGFRSLVARAASLVYPGQSFFVDASGRWVNSQANGTIVSPVIHTTPFEAYRNWVLDNWTWAYQPKSGDILLDLGTGVGEEAVTPQDYPHEEVIGYLAGFMRRRSDKAFAEQQCRWLVTYLGSAR